MKKALVFVLFVIVYLAMAIHDKYNKSHRRLQANQTAKNTAVTIEPPNPHREFESIDDKRQSIIKGYFGATSTITEISKPFMYNLKKDEHGLKKGDLVEFITVIYNDNQQQKAAVFVFDGTKLISVTK